MARNHRYSSRACAYFVNKMAPNIIREFTGEEIYFAIKALAMLTSVLAYLDFVCRVRNMYSTISIVFQNHFTYRFHFKHDLSSVSSLSSLVFFEWETPRRSISWRTANHPWVGMNLPSSLLKVDMVHCIYDNFQRNPQRFLGSILRLETRCYRRP